MGVDVKCFRLNRDLSFVAEQGTCELQLHNLCANSASKYWSDFCTHCFASELSLLTHSCITSSEYSECPHIPPCEIILSKLFKQKWATQFPKFLAKKKTPKCKRKKKLLPAIIETANIGKSERSKEVKGTKDEGKVFLLLQVHRISKIWKTRSRHSVPVNITLKIPTPTAGKTAFEQRRKKCVSGVCYRYCIAMC
jgi:hypothetical protein